MTDKEFRVCTNCGVMDLKSNIWNMNYADCLCDECSSNINAAKKLLKELAYEECHSCGEKFEDNNCEFCSFAYSFCSQECYDNYMKNEGS